MPSLSRRHFLQFASAAAFGFEGLRAACAQALEPSSAIGYGPLVDDPQELIDLPQGFTYRVISKMGETMNDGLNVPGNHDGMAAFAGPAGKTILVRNHECALGPSREGAFGWSMEHLPGFDRSKLYDPAYGKSPPLGGTTTLVYDTRSQHLDAHFLSLAGTIRNCAGGPTPWGSWITCEETEDSRSDLLERDHGYNFEVPASATSGLITPVPLKAMGRFRHEAVAVEPTSGIVYQTEDVDDGLIYRFLPHTRGKLHLGGRLQALSLRDAKCADLRHWDSPTMAPGEQHAVEWIDLEEVESPQADLRLRGFDRGAARFARNEGMWYGRQSVFFASTSGGPGKLGQIWRYVPSPAEGTAGEATSPGKLELFIESGDGDLLRNCDNLTVAPWGDLVISEDSKQNDTLVGITPGGEYYKLARNHLSDSEFAGATFAPDGSTLFVNMTANGLTLAIAGPWASGRSTSEQTVRAS